MEETFPKTEFKMPEIQKDTEGINEILKGVTARAVVELKVAKEDIKNVKTSENDRENWTNEERYEHLVDIALNGRIDSDGTKIEGWISNDEQGLSDLYDRVSFYQEQKDQREDNVLKEEQEKEEKIQEAKKVIDSISIPDGLSVDTLDTNDKRVLLEVKTVIEGIANELNMDWESLVREIGGQDKLLSLLANIN